MSNPLNNRPSFRQQQPILNMKNNIPNVLPTAVPPTSYNNGISQENIQQAKDMVSMLKQAHNPDELMYMVASKNPQLKTVMDVCRGQNPEQLFRQMCMQRGINPDEIIKAVTT